MVRWALLIACMLLTSLTASTAIHARELSGAIGVDCAGYVHSQGDRDESPGDADNMVQHHHASCHGMAAVLPGKAVSTDAVMLPMARPTQLRTAALGRWISGPDLKPPIA